MLFNSYFPVLHNAVQERRVHKRVHNFGFFGGYADYVAGVNRGIFTGNFPKKLAFSQKDGFFERGLLPSGGNFCCFCTKPPAV